MFVKIETDPEIKTNLKDKFHEAVEWVDHHRWLVTAALSVASTALYFAGKKHGKANIKLEEKLKDLRVYDPSMGHYWELKRKLRNSEWCEIERRLANGEKYGEILSSLGVLK